MTTPTREKLEQIARKHCNQWAADFPPGNIWKESQVLAAMQEALSEQEQEPCTDAKEAGEGCYRAVASENELVKLRSLLSQAQADTIERCAKVCEELQVASTPDDHAANYHDGACRRCAREIRALSGPEEGEESHAIDRTECAHVWKPSRNLTGSVQGPHEAVCRICGQRGGSAVGPEESKG